VRFLAGAAGVRQFLDFSQPVAVLLLAVLHFVADADRPYEAVRTIMDSLPSGSYLVLTHSTPDDVPDDVTKAMKDVTLWRPDRPSYARRSLIYGGVGLKP
jgi:S-adenosyl methyltransferase